MTPCYLPRPMRLIITEKNNSAKKIAEILSGGSAKDGASYRRPTTSGAIRTGEHVAIGLKGHVMSPAFPDGYSNWQETDLHELIDADLIKEPTDKNVVKAVRKAAKDADSIVIATDYDREGELIGLEALEQAVEANPAVDRRPPQAGAEDADPAPCWRGAPADQAGPLLGAHQGRDRARLLRARRPLLRPRLRRRRPPGHRPDLGRDAHPRRLARHPPLRVQLPLGRPRPEPDPGADRRARARAPRPRAEALLGGVREVRASRRRVRGPPRDRQVLGGGGGRRGARRHQEPGRGEGGRPRAGTPASRPRPYNTTAFTTDASSRLGITPAAAMRIAEDLYMDGFISYPRTDNTVYPPLAEHTRAGRRRWCGSPTSTPPRRRCSTSAS